MGLTVEKLRESFEDFNTWTIQIDNNTKVKALIYHIRIITTLFDKEHASFVKFNFEREKLDPYSWYTFDKIKRRIDPNASQIQITINVWAHEDIAVEEKQFSFTLNLNP